MGKTKAMATDEILTLAQAVGDYRFSRRAILRWVRTGTVQPAVPLEYADRDDPWTPEKERLVEAEIGAISAARRSPGTVGDLQAKESGK